VNLLIYLADQLLRGCQSADNQFQALQNQETEVFFSPRFLASRTRSQSSTNPTFCTDFFPLLDFSGLAGFGTRRIFCSSLLDHLETLLYFPFVLDYRTFLSVDFIYSVFLVLLRH
jgi:hypothetical protein